MREERLPEPEAECPAQRAAEQGPRPGDASRRSRESQYFGLITPLPPSPLHPPLRSPVGSPHWVKSTVGDTKPGGRPYSPRNQLPEHRAGWRRVQSGPEEQAHHETELTQPPSWRAGVPLGEWPGPENQRLSFRAGLGTPSLRAGPHSFAPHLT